MGCYNALQNLRCLSNNSHLRIRRTSNSATNSNDCMDRRVLDKLVHGYYGPREIRFFLEEVSSHVCEPRKNCNLYIRFVNCT